MSHQIHLSEACKGMIFYKKAAGLSDHTLADYRNSFKKLRHYFNDDPPISAITRQQLIEFFAWLQEDHVSEPDGVAPRGKIKLAPKSIKNIHTGLSALWTWAVDEGYAEENHLRSIDPPRVSPPVIEPFSREEVKKIPDACHRSRSWKTMGATTNARPTAKRDAAIIMLLMDTGLRASELCGITFRDINLDNNGNIYSQGRRNTSSKKSLSLDMVKTSGP